MTHRRIGLKKASGPQKLSMADAGAINEAFMLAAQDLASTKLPRNCESVRDEWLTGFREAVMKKVEAHCVEDDSLAQTTVAASDADARSMLGLEALSAHVLVAAEQVRDLRSKVLTKCAAEVAEHLATSRKALAADQTEVPEVAPPPPLSEALLEQLRSAVEKVAAALASREGQVDDQAEALQKTIQGVKRSFELREKDQTQGGASTAVAGAEDEPADKKWKAPADPTERFAEHVTRRV
mmetsp:Transcript_35742/g.80508  ORF Transcript_35742/g.80508 Transcript_35742/m.80508 type:complete len:239 (+) Transcript_35742:236-952(+)|eukprot:CAMPEP_0172639572 /NCGR_PEP_ID=MMETSP1068-20121228/219002_1 /TAXON_ID=35684 /ORGANISM="Pseudopedinella elastica, Strain CCMP716" /LENGTH=238 /DNA_ID=CAMNT_0013452755 /DNA_START=218 /DNA_END=934 /DNA_ORIENTATION=-